jgi:hypothetical protein
VADVVRGIMNGADMGEANHPDDEKAQGHRQHSLSDNVRADSGQMGGLGLLHVYPRRRYSFLAQKACERDLNFLAAGRRPGWSGGNFLSLQLVSAAISRERPPETPRDER